VPLYTPADTLVLLPAIVLVLFASAILVLDVLGSQTLAGRRMPVVFGLVGLVITGASLVRQWFAMNGRTLPEFTAAQDSITLDGIAFFSNAVVLGATVLLFLTSYRFLDLNGQQRSEYYSMALIAQAGMYIMATASELVTLALGIELTAVTLYILVGFIRADRRSNEAALKYLLLGAVSSGFLLYGFSLLYGVAGSTKLDSIATAVQERGNHDSFVVVAVITVIVGLFFKIAAVPFHTWAPDAYDGAPTPITAYLAVASKVAAFAVLLRLLTLVLSSARPVWEPLLVVAAVASITIGSFAALTQERLKRFFAYSSIAHVGYILFGLIAGTDSGLKGVYLYLLVYAVMNLGAFAILTSLHRGGITGEKLRDLRGLSNTHPTHAALFVVLLLSLAGLPPTAGFLAKYYIFFALIETGHFTLAILSVFYVAIGLYFYFRLVREMYMKDAERDEPLATSVGLRLALYTTTAVTLLVGLFPEPVLRFGFQLAGVTR
jgi:NADH-quinone oxidoreductase subunit N